MLVKILTLQAGPFGVRVPGSILDVHPGEAAALVAVHAAELVPSAPKEVIAEPEPEELEQASAPEPAKVERRPRGRIRRRSTTKG